MNREKVIEILKNLLDCSYVDSFDDEEKDALKIAVNVLEQKTDSRQGLNLDEFGKAYEDLINPQKKGE